MKLEWLTDLVYLKGQSEFYCRNQKKGLKCICVCVSGGGEGTAALHEPHAGGQSGLCAVPLVGLQRQEISGRTGTPVQPATGGTHTYVVLYTVYTDKPHCKTKRQQ